MKPKRKLSNIDFSKDGAHIAICHKDQGVANGADYALVIKAQSFSDEFIEKIQQVKVTMELPDFLERFFHLWEDDAEVLAYMMGYVEPVETQADELMESEADFQEWIKSRMEAFEIVKALHESSDIPKTLSQLSETEYLALVQNQEMIEKSFAKADKDTAELEAKQKVEKSKPKLKTTKSSKESPAVTSVTQADVNASTVQHEVEEGKGNSPVVKLKSKEKLMPDIKVVEQVVETEMIEKSQFDAIQKQASEAQELLKAAMQELELFKAEKQAMIVKARKQSVLDVVKDQGKADSLYGAIAGLADAEFDSVVAIVKSLSEQVEKSALFQEQGASVEDTEQVQESAVAKILKAQFTK